MCGDNEQMFIFAEKYNCIDGKLLIYPHSFDTFCAATWMDVCPAGCTTSKELSRPEKRIQLTKHDFLRKINLIFTVFCRVILLREVNLKTASMSFSPTAEFSNNRKI